MSLKALPNHIAIIMDGNGRWAKSRHLPRSKGHQRGVQTVRKIVKHCGKLGISSLTLFAFSSENWGRSSDEVNLLMMLLNTALQEEVPNLIKNSVQLNFIGDLSQFDQELKDQMKKSEQLTYCNPKEKKLDLVVAASYGGRWDIVNAINEIHNSGTNDLITEEIFNSFLSTSAYKDPDLCIRTGNEKRVSNFLLWQLAYSELYFPNILWPDFDDDEFDRALKEYSKRSRRFGDKSNFQL